MESQLTRDKRYSAAEYRVRLFLSVDLSGSTAFKNSRIGQEISDASPMWVKVFQDFYNNFPDRYRHNFAQLKNGSVGTDVCPSIWKAIGDEIVFCGRVTNKSAVVTALNAFIKTLLEYRKILAEDRLNLNVKGAAWLSAFPEPNRTVEIKPRNGGEEFPSATEALESAADLDPFNYDFLGKAIDTGFRVAGTAQPERFALSVQLARLLSTMPTAIATSHQIQVDHPNELKGVNNGIPYPNLYIETLDHLATKPIRESERKVLPTFRPLQQDIADYLSVYSKVAGTDEIALPDQAGDQVVSPPESYSKHRALLEIHLQQESGRGAEAFEELSKNAEPLAEDVQLETHESLNPLDT